MVLILGFIFAFSILVNTNFVKRIGYSSKLNNQMNLKLGNTISHKFEWYRTWGGEQSDWGNDIKIDANGDIYIVGATNSFHVSNDLLFLKYNISGDLQWNITMEGGNGFQLAFDSYNNTYVVGSAGGDILFLKYDKLGNNIWEKRWGGVNSEEGQLLEIDSNGDIYIAGFTDSYGVGGKDVAVLKYNSSGDLQWNNTWGTLGHELVFNMVIDSNDNLYIAGESNNLVDSEWDRDIFLLKFNETGGLEWNNIWGGLEYEFGSNIIKDYNNNIYIVGTTESYGEGGYDTLLLKYNSSGDLQWNKTWGGINRDYGESLSLDSNNNLYIAGFTNSYGEGGYDTLLLKYNSSGDFQWNKTWGGINGDYGRYINIDISDNVYVVGETESYGAGERDILLIKYDPSGNLIWNKTWGGVGWETVDLYKTADRNIRIDEIKNLYILGTTRSFGAGGQDIALVKFGYNYNISLTINSPTPGELFGKIAPTFDVEINCITLHKKWYSLNNGQNITFTNENQFKQEEWDKCGQGTVLITFYANNSVGTINFAKFTVKKFLSPNITNISPVQNQVCGYSAPEYNITIEDLYPINTTWYTIDGGFTNYTFSGLTGFINQTAWDSEDDGLIELTFYANDTLGQLGYRTVFIYKDATAPRIMINSPAPNQLCGITAPTFDLQIVEPNLQEKKYSLNGRPNITFTTETQFSQTEWNQVGNGTVSIIFYAIDKLGNTNSSEVVVRKDAYLPDIIINSPLDDQKFGKSAPDFNLTIIEEDLASTWYTIEGIAGTFPFTGLTGTINQDAWDDAPEGEITITYYAIDGAGNIGNESVIVTKRIPSKSEIPGYNLFLLLGIISIVSIIIGKKIKKN